ncbi:alpha/beta hydrolase-fold protein [Tenacibaculum soleae]|uniref:alpha/beta hydrolase-fold protein n=1 Tax=Tenacibaculum soleae TaxID=447689 RepID=UPI0026E3BFC3|nr:alpha/beta hydrolase-fold protein [Tenacibaculum soleae]MDO6745139.1 alpha/beta hydrolase-fold protein [Tenacibaculum soleae]
MKLRFLNIAVFAYVLLLALNTFSQGQYLVQIGKLDSIYSNTLKEQRKFWVQLPENYNKNKKYPVVYVLDGETHLPIVSLVQSYYSGGFIPEMILVGISNQQHRTRDLTISKITNRQGGAFNFETGGAENFTKFIANELIPYINKKFPVTNYRTLIGHSFGGLFTINTLIHHQELFANYLAIDPSLDWDNQKIINEAEIVLKTKTYKNKSLFISLGGPLHMKRNDITIANIIKDKSEYTLFGRSNLKFSELASTNKIRGIKTTWKFYKNEFHGTISFPSIKDGLVSFFDWYQIKEPHKFNVPETSTKELLTIIRKQEERYLKKFGYKTPPFDEELLVMSGYMYLEMGQKEKSLAFLNLAIEYYPNSTNAFNALTDYYVAQKDYKKALENITKAYKLSKEPSYLEKLNKLKQEYK